MLSRNLKGEANGNSSPTCEVGLILVLNNYEMSQKGVFRKKLKWGDDEK
jgi:hypothetical protein